MGERNRDESGYERDRARTDYSERYEPRRSRPWEPAENDWREDRNRYAGYYADRQYGTRGVDEREEGSRYGSEEDWRQRSRYEGARRYGTDSERYGTGSERYGTNSERYGRDWRQGGYSDYERNPGSSYTPGPYQSMPSRIASSQYSQRDWRSNDNDYREPRGREHESFGEQMREAGQRIARSVKRVFRGPKGYKRSDERIREDISDRLGEHEYLDCSEVEVSVANGEVTLTGTVRTRQEKFLAEEIADDVSGVNDVHNQLRVKRDATSSTNLNTASGVEATRTRNARA